MQKKLYMNVPSSFFLLAQFVAKKVILEIRLPEQLFSILRNTIKILQ